MTTLYILSGTFEEAQTWVHIHLKPDAPWTFIEGPEMLKALHKLEYVKVGSWRGRPDLVEVESVLREREALQKIMIT